MAYEQRDMSGSLFKNEHKESENHADYKGSAKVGGVEMWMDVWIKRKEGAKTYLSVSFKPKDGAKAVAPQQRATRAPAHADDDIPF